MTFVDVPDKEQKHPHYEHRTEKLDRKDNEFSSKKFHKIREKVSTRKKILKAFGRIGMCMNNCPTSKIPENCLNKICFILVNDYKKETDKLGVGPLNDGYLIGLKHHRLGFNVVYLYNPRIDEFTGLLKYLLNNTTVSLTVFYSGRNTTGNQGIEFVNGSISKGTLAEIIAKNSSEKPRVMFITDCIGPGSVFDIHLATNQNPEKKIKMIAFSVVKATLQETKEAKRSHGIFTYYFSKLIDECPNISPGKLIERILPSLSRFNETCKCEVSNKELFDSPIFFN